MPILSDCHLHTSHSGDSKTPMEEMILQGISKGLTTMCFTEHNDFEFIIGSSHLCNGMDPSCPKFYKGRSEEEAYREYFESIVENILSFSGFDVYGHLDYVVRYGPNADTKYFYEKYQDILDKILRLLIEKGKGISVLYCF